MCHPYTNKQGRFFREIGDYHIVMIHQLPSESKTKMPTNGLHRPSNIIRSLRSFEEVADGGSCIAYKVNFILSVCVHSSFTRVVTIHNCKGIVTYMNHLRCSQVVNDQVVFASQGIHIFIMQKYVNLMNCIDNNSMI